MQQARRAPAFPPLWRREHLGDGRHVVRRARRRDEARHLGGLVTFLDEVYPGALLGDQRLCFERRTRVVERVMHLSGRTCM